MSDPSDFEAVKSTNQAFYDAFSNRDIKSMNLLWWQGATSSCVHPGGAILTGWESIQASWRAKKSGGDFCRDKFSVRDA